MNKRFRYRNKYISRAGRKEKKNTDTNQQEKQ